MQAYPNCITTNQLHKTMFPFVGSTTFRTTMAAARQLLPHLTQRNTYLHASYPSTRVPSRGMVISTSHQCLSSKLLRDSTSRAGTIIPKALPEDKGIVLADDEDGVSLGTMKLPPNIDTSRFETLLFQWANSLCQGANLPLPVPLKVDRIQRGARLGFIEVDDGKTEVRVYIDCLVFPATESSGPIFRAIRNGPLKDQAPPGEPRIMRSLLQALQKSVEIASI